MGPHWDRTHHNYLSISRLSCAVITERWKCLCRVSAYCARRAYFCQLELKLHSSCQVPSTGERWYQCYVSWQYFLVWISTSVLPSVSCSATCFLYRLDQHTVILSRLGWSSTVKVHRTHCFSVLWYECSLWAFGRVAYKWKQALTFDIRLYSICLHSQ